MVEVSEAPVCNISYDDKLGIQTLSLEVFQRLEIILLSIGKKMVLRSITEACVVNLLMKG